jgi:hypothetical protein
MSVETMLYSDLKSGSQYINICRDLSWYNSKNMEHSDRDGNVYTYICNVKIHGSVENSISLGSAPNSWKMCNSFKKWHAYRDMMFKDAGVTESEKGRYGKTIRPYLDTGMHTVADVRTPVGWDVSGTPPAQTQEWTYTEIAAAPGFDAAAVGTEGQAAVDVYELNICGQNVASATTTLGTEYYSEVGMIHSYNQDRQEIVTPTLDSETIEGHNNPLALLRFKGTAGGEVMDIVETQESEAPPYDINDGGASTLVNTGDIMQINPGWDGQNSIPVIRTSRVMVHGGILKLYTTAGDTDASILVEVVGRVLSKDLA